MFARVCRFGHIGGQNETRARRRGRLYYDNDRGHGMTAVYRTSTIIFASRSRTKTYYHIDRILYLYLSIQNRVSTTR